MGTDKARLRLQPDGPTLLERVIQVTSGLADDVFIVSRSASDYDEYGIPTSADRYPGTGVLGGIGTALHHAASSKVLVVSCDMPFLSESVLRWMAAINVRYDALVPAVSQRTRQGGEVTFQTLHAIYKNSCIEAIESELACGNRKAIAFFERIVVRQIPEREIRALDPDMLTFFSVNTPDTLRLARSIDMEQQSKRTSIT